MLIIHHRRNTIKLIKDTPKEFGIEIDIRSNQNQLIVHHDPYTNGIKLQDLLKYYKHKLLILNVKEEGLEDYILEIMKENNIKSYFFLDQSFPFLLKTAKKGEKQCAIRVSEYESINTALAMSGLIEWIWIDIFNKLPINNHDYRILKEYGFKLCLVSPELQNFPIEKIYRIQEELKEHEIKVDAVCTKEPQLWIHNKNPQKC